MGRRNYTPRVVPLGNMVSQNSVAFLAIPGFCPEWEEISAFRFTLHGSLAIDDFANVFPFTHLRHHRTRNMIHMKQNGDSYESKKWILRVR